MYKLLTKHGQLFAVTISVVVIAIFFTLALVGLNNAGYDMSTDLIPFKKEIGFFDVGLYLTIALLVLAILIWLGFALYQMITNPKASMKFLIVGIAIAGIFLLFYFLTNTEVSGKLAELVSREDISDATHRLISGGLSTSIVLAGLALLVMLGTELVNIFK